MESDVLRGGDISMLNYVESMGAKFYDADGNGKDALQVMQENGVNIVRLRLYNNPGESVSYGGYTYNLPAGFLNEDDILSLALRAKEHGENVVGNTTCFDYEGRALPVFEAIAEDAGTSGITTIVHHQSYTNNKLYDLQGRCVQNPSKGLYIVRGRKVVIR